MNQLQSFSGEGWLCTDQLRSRAAQWLYGISKRGEKTNGVFIRPKSYKNVKLILIYSSPWRLIETLIEGLQG